MRARWSWRGVLALALGLVASLYLVVVGYLTLNQSKYFYYPDPRRPDLAATGLVGFTPVEIPTADGQRLQAWWSPPRDGAGVVLYLHGNGENRGMRAERFADLAATGAGVLGLDYRGYGGSTGVPSERGLYEDARAGWAFVRRAAPGRPVALFGESLGTGVAAQLATEVDERALMLDSPFSSFAGVIQLRAPWYPALLTRDRYDSLRKIGRTGSPLLIVHCDADAIVPFREGRRLFDAARQPKRFLPLHGCGHIDIWRGAARDEVLRFLATAVGAQPKAAS